MSLSKYLHWRWGTDACRKSSSPSLSLHHHKSSFRCWERLGEAEIRDGLGICFLEFSFMLLLSISFLESRIAGIGFLDTGRQKAQCLREIKQVALNSQATIYQNPYSVCQDSYPNLKICRDVVSMRRNSPTPIPARVQCPTSL